MADLKEPACKWLSCPDGRFQGIQGCTLRTHLGPPPSAQKQAAGSPGKPPQHGAWATVLRMRVLPTLTCACGAHRDRQLGGGGVFRHQLHHNGAIDPGWGCRRVGGSIVNRAWRCAGQVLRPSGTQAIRKSLGNVHAPQHRPDRRLWPTHLLDEGAGDVFCASHSERPLPVAVALLGGVPAPCSIGPHQRRHLKAAAAEAGGNSEAATGAHPGLA